MMKPSATRLPGYDDALARVLRSVPPLGVERVALSAALGRVLREEVKADRDQPPFDRSAMDGFAVRSGEVTPGASFPVVGSIAAGAGPAGIENVMPASAVMRIATGAPLPRGADAVVPIEQATVSGGSCESVTFHVSQVPPWQNVHRRAIDAARGAVVLKAGTRLGPQHIGIAAAVGAVELVVSQRPRITLLTTGDEVRPADTLTDGLEPQQIRNSNGPMLAAFLAALGVPLLHHEHVPDEAERTLCAAREALSHSHLVITNGGVSVGERDYLPWAWRQLGLNVVLQGVAIQPGRPVLACGDGAGEGTEARRYEGTKGEGAEPSDHSKREPRNSEVARNPQSAITNHQSTIALSKMVLGLPGNPVSVLATAHLFAWPVLRLMLAGGDREAAALPWRMAPLREAVTATSRRQVFRAARCHGDGSVSVIRWHGSGDLMHTAEADAFVRLPLQDEPIAAGTMAPLLPMVW
jgi:molybdopterin molybdotransferase